MSARVPGDEAPGDEAAAAANADVDTSELLDLDTTSFGLSAFGSERGDERVETLSPPQPGAGLAPMPAVPLTISKWPAPWPTTPEDTDVSTSPVPGLPHDGYYEAQPQPADPADVPEPPPWRDPALLRQRIVIVAAVVSVLAIVTGSMWAWLRPALGPTTTGELTVDSTPRGARVILGGKERGSTPLSLTLAPGTYELELLAGNERHALVVRVKSGATTAQHVFLRKSDATAPGTLRITSEPSFAAVAVDGRGRGTTPLLITDLAAGPHEVVVTGTSGSVRQRVRVDPAATTTVMVPLPRPPPPQSSGGWLSIAAPTELQVFEGDRLLGTTRVNPLMLPTGRHTLRLSSEAAGVDVTRQVTIDQGMTARLHITLPPGTVSINAVPWAVVSVDGREVGETPLGGVELSPGSHVVVFTHPEFGERRQEIIVRAGAASRVSVDLRR